MTHVIHPPSTFWDDFCAGCTIGALSGAFNHFVLARFWSYDTTYEYLFGSSLIVAWFFYLVVAKAEPAEEDSSKQLEVQNCSGNADTATSQSRELRPEPHEKTDTQAHRNGRDTADKNPSVSSLPKAKTRWLSRLWKMKGKLFVPTFIVSLSSYFVLNIQELPKAFMQGSVAPLGATLSWLIGLALGYGFVCAILGRVWRKIFGLITD